jgi:hypothetical protein
MMTKFCFVLAALSLLAGIACPVFGAKYTSTLDPYGWTDIDGICTYDRDVTWSYRSTTDPAYTNGLDVEELTNACPPVGADPRVRQNVLNNTLEDIWTDWHVDIVNGKNLRGIYVYKVGEGTFWQYELLPVGLGFFAHVTSAGPGNPMAVNPSETLYVEFTYDVDILGQPVTITQYPTTWYPIPEPSSIMALLAGMGAFGFTALRRVKK